ncbi:hypothetical protein MPDQ_004871 [Monascus purpureus]|uniref:Myb-like DNA-binding domain-containing protein n=1 Tax=Monascus purpureus TaxID=5098 RepID=A0A507QX64_MONPU|nr:hypothetical protein MPDQ_004871 [Monascus purpureus]BDD55859.1 hypothetical protein MAP00_001343 [Monascus purpureus]
MNARVSSDEQVQFLLSCIRYSVNGKIDFAEVAKECNIVSKGAANKRYERLMKAHNIPPHGTASGSNQSSPNKGETSTSTSASANDKKTTPSKRKVKNEKGPVKDSPAAGAKSTQSGKKRMKTATAQDNVQVVITKTAESENTKEEPDGDDGNENDGENSFFNEAMYGRDYGVAQDENVA